MSEESTHNTQGLCLRCERELLLYSRGLCKSCYIFWSTQVRSGKITWEELEQKGYVLGRGFQGRPTKLANAESVKASEFNPRAQELLNTAAKMAKELEGVPPLVLFLFCCECHQQCGTRYGEETKAHAELGAEHRAFYRAQRPRTEGGEELTGTE